MQFSNIHFPYLPYQIQRFPPIAALYDLQAKNQEKLARLLVLTSVFAQDNYHARPEEAVINMCQDRYDLFYYTLSRFFTLFVAITDNNQH